MSAKRAVMKWDAEAHEYMLICVFKHCELSGDKMGKVLADMHAKGYTFTENAFRQHVQKLRKARGNAANDDAGSGGSKPQTPRKTAAAGSNTSTPRKRGTPAKKRKIEVDEDADELGMDKFDDESQEDAELKTPVKREPPSDDVDWNAAVYSGGKY